MNAHNTKQYPYWETELDNAKSTSKVAGIALILIFLIVNLISLGNDVALQIFRMHFRPPNFHDNRFVALV